MRVLVYTSIFGNYDTLKVQPKQTVDSVFYNFTEPHEEFGYNPRLQAKYYKVVPHRILGNGMEFDYTIWIDGSIQIKSAHFVEYMISQAKDSWAMFKHPWRDCIYDEIAEAYNMKKYLDQPLILQGEEYMNDGMPEHWGMPTCGIICRNTKNLEVMALGELWWREILNWGIKDQVSLPYVLYKNNRSVNICDKPLFNNGLFTIHAGHRAGEYEKCKR